MYFNACSLQAFPPLIPPADSEEDSSTSWSTSGLEDRPALTSTALSPEVVNYVMLREPGPGTITGSRDNSPLPLALRGEVAPAG